MFHWEKLYSDSLPRTFHHFLSSAEFVSSVKVFLVTVPVFTSRLIGLCRSISKQKFCLTMSLSGWFPGKCFPLQLRYLCHRTGPTQRPPVPESQHTSSRSHYRQNHDPGKDLRPPDYSQTDLHQVWAFNQGCTINQIHKFTKITKWIRGTVKRLWFNEINKCAAWFRAKRSTVSFYMQAAHELVFSAFQSVSFLFL